MHGKAENCSCGCKIIRVELKQSILIIEDENLVAWDIEQTLRDHDFEDITVISSVRGARKAMQSVDFQVSLVILDLKLTDGNGRDLIDEFLDRGISVVVMTGYSDFAHPSVPVLHKPFASSELMQTVRSLLGCS